MPVRLTEKGKLPPGYHEYTLQEVQAQFTFTVRRKWLWAKLLDFLEKYAVARASHELWIDGSFTEDKPEPFDIDVLFVHSSSVLTPEIVAEITNLLAESEIFTREHGIDFKCEPIDGEVSPEIWLRFFSHCNDWNEETQQPTVKGIILVRL